jgi:hypothetical protein
VVGRLFYRKLKFDRNWQSWVDEFTEYHGDLVMICEAVMFLSRWEHCSQRVRLW